MPGLADRLRGLAGLAGLVLRLARLPAPPARGLDERLSDLPVAGAPVQEPVEIRWDEHALPFITAGGLADLGVGLGVVHAHLRLGQMEIMRAIAHGRIAGLIGPAGLDYDIALRTLDLTRAVPGMIAMLPPESRLWAESFLAGVNHVIANAPAQPLECRLLGIARLPWTMTDLFALARLASADITWLPALKLLRQREAMAPADWLALWPDLLAGAAPDPDGPLSPLARGSNSVAIGGARTASGAAMIASDPHVGLQLPSLWLACGMAAPGLTASGLMIPGLPTVAIGRNEHIAWGATNLHAASCVLIDLDRETNPNITERQIEIAFRGATPRTVTLRESRFGPVISDIKMLRLRRPTALAWIGHRPSDELTAMLALNRAANFETFRAALQGFAVQGYSFTYADTTGRTGIVRAAHVPARAGPPADVIEPAATMASVISLAGLMARSDPPEHVVVSANEDPGGGVTAGFFYSPPSRARRLAALANRTGLVRADLEALQRDVHEHGALFWRDHLAARAAAIGLASPAAWAAWNGDYAAASAGALAHEIIMAEAARLLIGPSALAPLLAAWTSRDLTARRLLAAPDSKLRPALAAAFRAADRAARRGATWGAAHRLRLAHPLARLPFGAKCGRFLFGVPGSNDTLYKMGHPPVAARGLGRHTVTYGASARHIADLAEPDIHHVAILGGQDGWIGSLNASDQIPLWRAGRYLILPVTAAGAARFGRVTRLLAC